MYLALVVAIVGVGAISCIGVDDGGASSDTSREACAGVEPEVGCNYYHSALLNSSALYGGYVKMWNNSDTLVVDIRGEAQWLPGSWQLKNVQIDIGDIWSDFRDLSAAPVAETEWAIPLADIGAACYEEYTVTVVATIVRGTEEAVVYGYGEPLASGPGWSFQYYLCCEESSGCTYTVGYWKTHPAEWPVSSLAIGGRSYTASELLALLNRSPRGDASVILAHQLIAARLNVAAGARPGRDVANALQDAEVWMSVNVDRDGALPFRVTSSSPAGQQAVAYSTLLTSFNEGSAGTPHCDTVAPAE